MSRPRDPDGADDASGEGWHEPAHLGGEAGGEGAQPGPEPAAWEPPGWSLPDAPERGSWQPAGTGVAAEPVPVEPVPAPLDPYGLRDWAAQHGWTVSDGDDPRDAVLTELLATAPVRLTSDYRPANVLRGRYDQLELVAFDVVFPLGKRVRFEHAVTAAPVLGAVPRLRLTPARFWKHGTGGLLRIPGGDAELDQRWVLLAAEDGPQVRRLVGDPAVRGLLLGSDDGDEFWTAAGHVAAIRPDAHRPLLLDHHARLLTAVLAALSAPFQDFPGSSTGT